jgi:NAD(P)-dependent dehydrogenase (short-subunit alcohol dehydrogenase family)
MSGRSRACAIVTRAQPPAAGVPFSSLWAGLLSLVPESVVFADGHCRVVVAGAQGPVVRVIGQDDAAGADSLDINFLSAVRLTSAVLPALQASGTAAIVNVSSGGATPLPAPLLHYGAAKSALNAYTLGLAAELAPEGIRVNIVTPGPVRSPGGDEIRQAFADAMGAPPEAMTAMIPLSRFGEPEEVAEMVALLVSDRGRWITMHNYFVDGGLGAK